MTAPDRCGSVPRSDSDRTSPTRVRSGAANRPGTQANQPIDAADMLDLLGAAIERDALCTTAAPPDAELAIGYTPGRSLVGHALSEAGIPATVLEKIGGTSIRDLWREDRLPVPMTLVAVLVLHRAQVAADSGAPWISAYEHAWQAALRLVHLVADSSVAATDGLSLGGLERRDDH